MQDVCRINTLIMSRYCFNRDNTEIFERICDMCINFIYNDIQRCMSRGRSLAPRQPGVSKSAASPRRFDASPRSCFGLNVKLRYDITIHNFHPFIFSIYVFKTFKTKLHICISSVFRCKLNVFGVCVTSRI